MRVNEIYERVIQIGKRLPGKLVELNFFSHGNETGPLLTNYLDPFTTFKALKKGRTSTFDPDEILFALRQTQRGKSFFDVSVVTDFDGFLMDNGNDVFLDGFRKAWHPYADIYAWGYTTTPSLQLLMQALFMQKNINSLAYDDVIVLKNPSRGIRLLLKRITGDEHSPVRVKVKFGHVLYVLAQILKSSYMYHLAKTAFDEEAFKKNPNLGVQAGVPGCFTDFKKGMNEHALSIGPEFRKYRQFFFDHFKLKANFPGDTTFAPGYMLYPADTNWDDEDFPPNAYEKNDV